MDNGHSHSLASRRRGRAAAAMSRGRSGRAGLRRLGRRDRGNEGHPRSRRGPAAATPGPALIMSWPLRAPGVGVGDQVRQDLDLRRMAARRTGASTAAAVAGEYVERHLKRTRGALVGWSGGSRAAWLLRRSGLIAAISG